MKFSMTTARPFYHPIKDADDICALKSVGFELKEDDIGTLEAIEFEKEIATMEEFESLIKAMDCDVIISRPRFGAEAEMRRYDYWVE